MIRIGHLIFQDFSTHRLLSDLTLDEYNFSASHHSRNLADNCSSPRPCNLCQRLNGQCVSSWCAGDMSWQLAALWSVVASQTSSEHLLRLAQATSLVLVFAELYSLLDYDRLADSFVTNCPQLCTGRTLFMIDCRPFRDPGYDKSFMIHVGFHPRNFGPYWMLLTTEKSIAACMENSTAS